MEKRILTIQDLYEYLVSQNSNLNFTSIQSGFEISVSTNGQFEVKDSNDDEGLVYCNLKAFHDLSNANGSYIDEDVFKQRVHTLNNRPIMADIVEVDDGNGGTVKDFSSHTMYYDEDKNKMIYVEIPVGHVINPENIRVKYDEEYKRDFAEADCVVYEEYTDACEILRRRNQVDCSVELCIRAMSYCARSKELHLDDYYVQGITLLGANVAPGMKGSNVSLKDFSADKNSIFCKDNFIDEITQAIIEKLDDHIANTFANNNQRKEENGLENQFEEKIEEEVTEVADETMTEEETPEVVEVEEETAEFDGDDEGGGDPAAQEETTEPEEGSNEAENLHGDLNNGKNGNRVYSVNGMTFEVSLSEIQYSLYELVNNTYAESDNDYYCVEVYEGSKTVVMSGMFTGRSYRQSYKVRNGVYSLTGDRVPVKCVFVTSDEEAELDRMRSNYSAISEKLAKYEAEPEKMSILNSEDYASISNLAEFMAFKEEANHFDLTVDEVKQKADAMLLQCAKSGKLNFAMNNTSKEEPKKTNTFFAFAPRQKDTSFLDNLLNK